MIKLALYIGMGFLAHWLWLGSHIDPDDAFSWACLLLGPIMVFVWLAVKGVWLALCGVLIIVGVIFLWVQIDEIGRRWRRRRLPLRKR
jgi:hypothetical protein